MSIELISEASNFSYQESYVDKSTYQLPSLDLNTSVVELEELARLLEVPSSSFFDQNTLKRIEECRVWHHENITLNHQMKLVSIQALEKETVVLESGMTLNSVELSKQLESVKAEEIIVAGITLGKNLDEQTTKLWGQDKYDESYILSMYGTALIEEARSHLNIKLCHWAEAQNLSVLPPMAPGYNNWLLQDLPLIFELLDQKDETSFDGKMSLLLSGMLTPIHSTLYVFGLTQHQHLVKSKNKTKPCQNCFLKNCQYRRVPERFKLKGTFYSQFGN